jgi:hypothetical protein
VSTWDSPAAAWEAEGVSWAGQALVPMPAPLYVLPDAERIVADFLRAQPELAMLDGRIYTVLPAAPSWPAVRVVRWGGQVIINRPLWLETAMCQVDVWGGGGKFEASLIARTMRALLAARLVAAEPQVVSAVAMGSLADDPDVTYQPARPRFRFDTYVTIHPRRDAPAGLTREPDAPARLSA